MQEQNKVLIIGSESSVKGGITSVIDRFLEYEWNQTEIELHPTYIEGNFLRKNIFFVKSMIIYIYRLLQNNFNIAHIHMSYKGSFFRKLIVVKLSRLFNKKVVLHLHGSEFEVFYESSPDILKKLIKNLFESCDSVIVLGDKWKDVIKNISPNSNIEVFNNAVNVEEYTAEWNYEKLNVLFLGVLIKRKGIHDLIDTIKILHDNEVVDKNKLNFIIGGSGPLEEEIKDKIKEYNLDYCVEMKGWVNGELKHELLRESQLFVLPSYNEGLPMAILEAMSYGIPTISTDVGSISEVVITNETGVLVEKGNSEMLAKSIEDILSNHKLWNKLSKNSKLLIDEKFNESNYFKEFEILYNKINKQY